MRISALLPPFDRGGLAIAAAFWLGAFSPFLAGAAPLDKNTCAKLALDMQNMKSLEIDKLMEKGPAWAISHLAPADLSLIRRYIDLDDQMRFRCAAPGSLVHLKHIEEDEDEAARNNTAEAAEPGAKKELGGDGARAASSASEKSKAAKAPKEASSPAAR